MTDLYATLGVPRDADRATIRRAYRQRAKAVHPDTGGSPERFALVRLAHDTLTDDLRRAKYDATGDIDDKPIDNTRAQLLEMLAAGLDLALSKLYDRAKPPIHNDMADLTRRALREMRGKWADEKREFEKRAVIAGELLGRWTAKGENLMETLIVHRVRVCQSQVTMLNERIGIVDRALKELDGVTFRSDYVREESPAQRWINGPAHVSLGDLLGR